jgi:hypothetical protein
MTTSTNKTLRVTALLLDIVGTIMLSAAVLLIHQGIEKDKKIDMPVLLRIFHERNLTIAAMVLIGISFLLSLIAEIELF